MRSLSRDQTRVSEHRIVHVALSYGLMERGSVSGPSTQVRVGLAERRVSRLTFGRDDAVVFCGIVW
jgi:hypothetical protein